jgi:hypothetical protein
VTVALYRTVVLVQWRSAVNACNRFANWTMPCNAIVVEDNKGVVKNIRGTFVPCFRLGRGKSSKIFPRQYQRKLYSRACKIPSSAGCYVLYFPLGTQQRILRSIIREPPVPDRCIRPRQVPTHRRRFSTPREAWCRPRSIHTPRGFGRRSAPYRPA